MNCTRASVNPLCCIILAAFGLLIFATAVFAAAIPAFPGAEGYGAYAVGGRGGDVYHVTNLNASGAGSFADAIATAPAIGRTIVFDVSGYIRFPSSSNGVRMTNSKITIAGQTAPGDGIGFYNNFFRISGDDVVIRHVRFRMGKNGSGGDCVDLDSGCLNAILDHVSMEFSTDENMSSFGSAPENLTLQYSLNAWGLESHSCGGLWDQKHATSHHNLWAHNHTRNPKARPTGLLEWINNVTFDWDIGFIMGDTESVQNYKANVLSNYFIGPPGNTQSKALVKGSVATNGLPNFSIYLNGNLTDIDGDGILNGTDRGYGIVEGSEYSASESPAPASGAYRYYKAASAFAGSTVGVATDNALTAYKKIVSNAGALRLDANYSGTLRDEVDTILFNKLVTQTAFHVTRESATGASNSGFGALNSAAAPIDTDQDGMPDYYETALGWNAGADDHTTALASSGGVITGTTFFPANTPAGYTRLEEYLHFLAIPHGTAPKNLSGSPSSITIDLSKYTGGFSPPTLSVANVVGGTVALSGTGNKMATFTPTVNYTGRGRFEFTVTDPQGSAWTQTFALVVANNALPRDLLWKGDGSANAWDTMANNWLRNDTATAFSGGDFATFNDTGSMSPVATVSASGVATSGIVVNSTGNYTFSGAGLLSGALTKRGAGALTINSTGANALTPATLEEGTLSLPSGGGLGAGTLTMSGGTLALGISSSTAIALAGNATIAVSGSPTFNGALSGAGTLKLTLGGSGTTSTLAGSMTGFKGTIALGTSNGALRFNSSSTAITGSAAATFDLGTGNATLSNRNGNLTIDLGALSGGPNTKLSGATSATTYSIGATGADTTFAGAITNGSSATTAITKVGNGALTLSGASAYTGATTVSAGTLIVAGALGNTPVTVASGAMLAGGGAIGSATGGAVAVSSGAYVSPGTAPFTGATLTVGNGLTLGGSTLYFDLSNSPTGANDKIALNGGTLTLTGTQSFQFLLLNGTLGAGTYPLISGGTATAGSNIALAHNLPTGSRQTFRLDRSGTNISDGFVSLVVTGSPATLTWTGAASNTWGSNATVVNWSGAPDGNNRFIINDAATFDDNSTVNGVNLSGSVQPRVVTFDNSAKNYTLGGTGFIGGSAALVKSGTGTLTISPAQFSLASATNSGSATVTMTSTASLAVGMAVEGVGIPANTTILAIPDGATVTLSQNATATGAGVALSYYAKNTFTGGTTINAGSTILLTSDIANAYGLGAGPINLNGGKLSMYANLNTTNPTTYNFVVPAGQTGAFSADSRVDLSGTLSGAGTFNFFVPWIRTTLYADWSAFTGVINVTTDGNAEPGGGNTVLGGDFRMGTSYSFPGFPLAAVNLGDKVYAYYVGTTASGAGTTVEIGELSGTSSSGLQGGVTGARNFTYRIGGRTPDGSEAIFAGPISEQGPDSSGNLPNTALVKTGAGVWTLGGPVNLNGGVTVEQGTLKITNSLTCGGSFSVQNGAGLTLAGGSITTDAVNIATGAALAGSGTINGDLNNDSTITAGSGQLIVTGDVVNNGTIRFTGGAALSATGAFVNNGVLDLLTGSGGLPANLVNNGVAVDSSAVKVQDVKKTSNTVSIAVASYSGHNYQLQRANSLVAPITWNSVGALQTGVTQASGQPTVLTLSDTAATGGQAFYRVQIVP